MNLDNILKGYVDITQTDKSKKDLNNVKQQIYEIKNESTTANKVMKITRGQIMGIGFAALFGGMALQRVFGGALRSLFTNYSDVIGETHSFTQQTNQLSGAWTFFKFTLIDALAQSSLFQNFIQFVVRLIDGVSQFNAKYPGLAKMTVIFFVLALVIATVAMVLGQPILMLSILGTAGSASILLLLKGFGAVIGILLILALMITTITSIWDSDMPVWLKWLSTIGISLVGITAGFALFGKTGLIALAGIGKAIGLFFLSPWGIAILAIVLGVVLLTQKLGSVGNAFKALGIFVLAILAFIGDGIYEMLITPLRLFILMVNGVISGLHALGFATHIKTIEQPEFGGLSKKVWEMRNNLLNDAHNIKEEESTNPFTNLNYDPGLPSYDTSNSTAELDALALEAQNITKEYTKELVNNSYTQTDYLKNIAEGLEDVEEVFKDFGSKYNLNSTTVQ